MNWTDFVDGALFASVVRALIPVLLAALAGLICERSGVFNIALEGLMLVGAFAAVAGSYYTGSGYLGALAAVCAGVLVAAVLAYGSVTRRADPIVLSVALNIFAVGITGFLLVALFGVRGVFQDPRIAGLPPLRLPGLADIPWIGQVLFSLTLLGYLALVLVAAVQIVLFRFPLGLRLRGVGERPQAASTLGVSPTAYQYGAVLLSGVLCGLAGAQLALGNVVQFSENMTSGRGWIAVVAVMLGRAHPIGTLGACVLFGLAEAVGFRLQGNGLPAQITDAAPYVVTLVALLLARRHFNRDVVAATT
ncbi:MAG TPA: ABC transporter permease [Jiangellales bacterium]|nr:ABC transporter permease [Jiangellales bacterium]